MRRRGNASIEFALATPLVLMVLAGIVTGTNHRGLNPFQDGDLIELECEGLGRLQVGVRDDLKREWKRESRIQRKEQGLEGFTPQISGKYADPAPAGSV